MDGPVTYTSLDGVASLVPGGRPVARGRDGGADPRAPQLASEGWGWAVDFGSFIGPGAGYSLFGGSEEGDSTLIGRYGGFWPADRVQLPNHSTPGIFTEPQWRASLMWARWLDDYNPLAIGFRGHVCRFIGGMDVAWVRRGQDPGAIASGEDAADPLLKAVEQFWEEWCELESWGEGVEDREEEAVRRDFRDGECWLRTGPGGPDRGGLPWARFIEPEQVRSPTGIIPGDWDQSADAWRWGVHCDPEDEETERAYWVCDPDSGGARGEVVPAAEVVRSKSNVDRTIRRGKSDYFCVERSLQEIVGVLANMEGTARELAGIAWLQEWAYATPDQLRQLLAAPRETYGRGGESAENSPTTGGSTTRGFPLRNHNGRRVLHTTAGTQFKPGPTQEGVPSFSAAIEASLKAVGFRFGMPDWFAGGSADSFASVLVTGSPFVREIEARQKRRIGFTKRLAMKVVELAERTGRLKPGTAAAVRPVATAKPVVMADEAKQVSTWKTELDAKTLDPQEWIRKRGRDPKVVAANIKAWEKEFPGAGGAGGPVAPGAPPPDGAPEPGDPKAAPPGSAGGDGSDPPPDLFAKEGAPINHRREGEVWKGPSGRYFTLKAGRVVPHAAPGNGEGGEAAPGKGEGGEAAPGKGEGGEAAPGKGEAGEAGERFARTATGRLLIDKNVQRWAEGHNEPEVARHVGGHALADNEPVDVVIKEGEEPRHGIELKTMVANAHGQIHMNTDARKRKHTWRRQNRVPVHTVVIDDRAVFHANGPGQHDLSKRKVYYRRGVGSFKVGGMHEVEGGLAGLRPLLEMPTRQLPPGAWRPKPAASIQPYQANGPTTPTQAGAEPATPTQAGAEPAPPPGVDAEAAATARKWVTSMRSAKLSPEQRQKYGDHMAAVLTNMTPQCRKAAAEAIELGSVQFLPTLHDVHAAAERATAKKQKGLIGGFVSANPGDKAAHLYVDGGGEHLPAGHPLATHTDMATPSIYAHELGHVVDVGLRYSGTGAWKAAWMKEINTKGSQPLGPYSCKNTAEGFAEFHHALTLGDREKVKARFPRCWSFFEKNGLL